MKKKIKSDRGIITKTAKRAVPFFVLGTLLGGCAGQQTAETEHYVQAEETENQEDGSQKANEQESGGSDLFQTDELFSDQDFDSSYDVSTIIQIHLEGDSASCESENVEISGTTVTIKEGGTYLISGTLKDGMIIVDTEDTDQVQLVLDQVTIENADSAAVYVRQADHVFLSLPAGTESSLTNGGSYVAVDENNIDAVIFSKADLTLQGAGTLRIQGTAGHGVVSKDSLIFTGGTYVVDAAEHGLSGKDDICIAGGSFTITAGKDGVHAENKDDASKGFLYIRDGSFVITADGAALSAGSDVQIDGGDFDLNTGGGAVSVKVQEEAVLEEAGKRPEGDRKMMEGNEMAPEGGPQRNGGEEPAFRIPEETETTEAGTTEAETAGEKETEGIEGTEEETVSMKGVKAAGHLNLNGGTFSIDTADDAVHADSVTIEGGTFEIMTGDDGIHAEETLLINGGSLTISQSYEGLEGAVVEITGGEIEVTSSDDGMNASAETAGEEVVVRISGGSVRVNASGDGIDSNGDLEITGGEIYVSGSDHGANEAIDYDGEADISGGILAAAGTSGMLQTISSSVQGVICTTVQQTAAGEVMELVDEEEQVLVSWTPDKAYDAVIISTPQIKEGSSYILKTGEVQTEIVMDGLSYTEGVREQPMGEPGQKAGNMQPGEKMEDIRGMQGTEGMDETGKPARKEETTDGTGDI